MHANCGAGAVRREQNIENLWLVQMVRPVRCFIGPAVWPLSPLNLYIQWCFWSIGFMCKKTN